MDFAEKDSTTLYIGVYFCKGLLVSLSSIVVDSLFKCDSCFLATARHSFRMSCENFFLLMFKLPFFVSLLTICKNIYLHIIEVSILKDIQKKVSLWLSNNFQCPFFRLSIIVDPAMMNSKYVMYCEVTMTSKPLLGLSLWLYTIFYSQHILMYPRVYITNESDIGAAFLV